MSDDSFIREVNEEIRQDQARALWDRFGPAAIALAVAVVLGTAAYVAYDYWVETRANRSGDQFSQALALANSGKPDEALAALKTLEEEGYGAYPLLARMRAATVLAEKGDFAGAVKEFDAVSADTSILRRRLGKGRGADGRHQHATPRRPRGARAVGLERGQVGRRAEAV
jgi:hypothetical protein